jgi:hypothetical protein
MWRKITTFEVGLPGEARVDTVRVINLPNTIKGISTKAYSLSPYIKPYKALLIPLPYSY